MCADVAGVGVGVACASAVSEASRTCLLPELLPDYLPDDWRGGFLLLVGVFVISSFLDNIAAALIGGAMAHQLFRAKVHIGFLAAIVPQMRPGDRMVCTDPATGASSARSTACSRARAARLKSACSITCWSSWAT